jgi:nicotinamidase-related amidase
MTERAWDRFLTERDKRVFAAAGYGAPAGVGERPALLVIDASVNFTGERPEPILEMIKTWHNGCGEEGWVAIGHIRRLLDACRERNLPVIYTTGERRSDGFDLGSWGLKNARYLEDFEREERGNAIVPDIAPLPGELVIKKQKPSAFFGTPLLSHLVELKIDTLLVTGVSTSGCVRASVIDGFSYNYRVAIIEEGCYDRSQASHAINLCDMNAKYADVVSVDEAIGYVKRLPDGLFRLPRRAPAQ